MDKDFSDNFIQAVQDANAKATPWELQSVKQVTSVIQERLLEGPISVVEAFKISSALPLALHMALATPPLTKGVQLRKKFVPRHHHGPAPPPHRLTQGSVHSAVNPEELILDTRQGLRAWYYLVAQAPDPLYSGTVPVFFILYQTAIHASKGVSAWACMASATVPNNTQAWLPVPCAAILEDSQVGLYANRVTLRSPDVTGYIEFAETGRHVTVDVKFASPALAFSAVVRSELGPVVHARGSSIANNGPLQTRRWSLLDGVLTAANIKIGDALARDFTTGSAWFDFQQQGLSRMSPIVRMIASALNPSSVVQSWLEISVKTPSVAVYVKLKEPTTKHPMWRWHGKGMVWSSTVGIRYGVPITVVVLAAEDNGTPAEIEMHVKDEGEFVLQGRSGNPAAASFIASLFYISPCTVAVTGNAAVTGTGFIQYVPPTLNKAEIIRSAGLAPRLIHAFGFSKTARTALVLSIFVMVCIVAAAATAAGTALKH